MLSIALTATLCFVFGAIIGSFLGVCAYRIPMGHYEPVHEGVRELASPVSIWRPARSFCPQCEKQLLWWHNVPLVSFLLLRARCAFCSAKIPFRYFFIELLTGALCTMCYLRFGLNPTGYAAFAVVAALVVVIFIDLDYMIIPDKITYPGILAGLAVAAGNEYLCTPGRPFLQPPFVSNLHEAFLGLLCGPGVLLFVWGVYWLIRRREGLGLGDIKLLGVLGATFGAEASWFTILFGSILGTLFGVSAVLFRKRGFSTYIPFGPYLVAAALMYILKLDQVVLYLIRPEGLFPWRVLQGVW